MKTSCDCDDYFDDFLADKYCECFAALNFKL